MEMTYKELKDSAEESFHTLVRIFGYSIESSFYAFWDDYDLVKISPLEKVSVYLAFSVVLEENTLNIDFLKDDLLIMLTSEILDLARQELEKADFAIFEADFYRITSILRK